MDLKDISIHISRSIGLKIVKLRKKLEFFEERVGHGNGKKCVKT